MHDLRLLGPSEAEAPVTAEQAASCWSALAAAGVRSWVIGGWGIDALLARKTREHHDLDVFVERDDLPVLLALLERPGSGIRYLWEENREHDGMPSAFVATLDGVELDVHVVHVRDGGIDILSEHSIELSADALGAHGTIAGTRVACAAPDAQRLMHTGYALPSKHHDDLRALDAAFPG